MICNVHGESDHFPKGKGWKCRECYNLYMSDYMTRRYHRRREEWLDRLGRQCVDCGTTQELEFDHEIAEYKEYNIAKILSGGSNAKVEYEMLKCVLRCAACHLTKSLQMQDMYNVSHGGGESGKRNCPCAPCKEVKASYMKEYMKTYNRIR